MSLKTYHVARETVVALNRLVKRSARPRKTDRASHFDRDRRIARAIFADPNILGYGVSSKVTRGERNESEVSLVFFVRKKLPKARLKYNFGIPVHFQLETVGRRVETDVQVWDRFPLAHSSVTAGTSIGDTAGNAGTMTLVVTDNDSGNSLMLSCSHVIARCGMGAVGDPVESPANLASNPRSNVVGSLQRFTIIDRGALNNAVDAAVASPLQGIELSNAIPGIGIPGGIRDLTNEGDSIVNQLNVRRTGLASGPQSGTIRSIHVTTQIDYPQLRGDPSVYFTELVQYDAPSKEGDSGAAVVDDGAPPNVVGMHIAGSHDGSTSFFTHIGFALEDLNVAYQAPS